jgi:pimeloyl-ACP methyl ester carboxylesterase
LSTPPNLVALGAAAPRIVGGSVARRRLWIEPAMFSPEFLERDPDRAQALLRTFYSNVAAPWGIWAQFLAAALHDRALDLHRIRAPTLIVHGDHDVLVPVSNARLLLDGIPDAELHLVEGAGHGAAMEHLDSTFAVIQDWLERKRPVAAPPAGGIAGHTERLSRALSIHLGALRVGRSSAVLASRFIARQAAAHRRDGSPRR